MTLEKNENIVFKNCKAVKPLGRGSYGNVYEMYDPVNNESFALKEVPISSENVSSFMAEILPDCVVCHENIQKYHPFTISRRPAILKNLYNCLSSPKKKLIDGRSIKRPKEEDFKGQNYLKIDDKDRKIIFTNGNDVGKEDDYNVGNSVYNNLDNKKGDFDAIENRSYSWSLGQKFRNDVAAKSKKFYMYLKTKICDFSLRDFIDFRNHLLFRTIDDNETFEGQLDNQVQISLDLYKKSVLEDKKINKKFSFGIFRCILLGLIHLHSFGIAHNDIKSSNILLDSKDFFIPKIADFGMKTYCEEKHGIKNSKNPYNFYDYCTNFSSCTHSNRNKVEDCKALIYILYELLYPCKTQSEMLYLLKDLKKMKKVPKDFKILYNAEAKLIERVLTDNNITASSMLKMFDSITE